MCERLPTYWRKPLITFNIKITHLSDVSRSSQEYRGWLKKRQLTQSGSGYEARSNIDGRLKGMGRASSATGYPPQ